MLLEEFPSTLMQDSLKPTTEYSFIAGQQEISLFFLGLEVAGPAVFLEFLTFEDPAFGLVANATRVRINAPLDLSIATEVADIMLDLLLLCSLAQTSTLLSPLTLN